MSNQPKLNIEASLSRSISQAPGLDFEKLAALPVVKMTGHDYITRQQPTPAQQQEKRQRYFKPISMAVAGALVMLVCVTTWFAEFKSPENIIALDANQSVEIVTNKHKQILSVKAFDQEVQKLLDEEHLDQSSLEDSVGVIITAMIKNGNLDENKSVVMVTVQNQNAAKADDLAASLNQVIKDSATAENVSATVVRQSVIPDSQAVTEAEQYNVSTGKLNVMKELVVADKSLTMETLASLSLTDLLAVSKEKSVDLTNVITVDEPEKETKDISSPVTPIADDPEITIPEPATETTVNANGKAKEPEVSDPVVSETPEDSGEAPVIPEESVITPPEKETEAVDEEKKPLSEEKNPTEPIEPEEAPAEEPTEEPMS
ncbi:hypothetical protein [Acetobacterium sp.]|uniref:anti-sigma-I factor RsgI family protein n=1 Tax=Acetobacterium sp. TaxID=1872094 RepID=UPI0035936206